MRDEEYEARALWMVQVGHRRVTALVVVAFVACGGASLALIRVLLAWAPLGADVWARVVAVEVAMALALLGGAILVADRVGRGTSRRVARLLGGVMDQARASGARFEAAQSRFRVASAAAADAHTQLRRTAGQPLPTAVSGALGGAEARLRQVMDLLDGFAERRPAPFGLRRVLERAAETAAVRLPLRVSVRDDVPEMVRGDGPRVERLLEAILSEASARAGRGSLDVVVEAAQEGHVLRVRLQVQPTDGEWEAPGTGDLVLAQMVARLLAADIGGRFVAPAGDGPAVLWLVLGRRREDDALITSDWDRAESAAPVAAAAPAESAAVGTRQAHATLYAAPAIASARGVEPTAPSGGPVAHDDDGDQETVQLEHTQTIDLGDLHDDAEPEHASTSGSGSGVLSDRLIHTTTASPLVRRANEHGTPRRILVADDDAMTRWALTGQLSLLGYSVDAVASAHAATDAFKLRRYDAVILNVQMQAGSGFSTAARLRALQPGGVRTPFVALSARVDRDEQVRCDAAGFDALIARPVDPERVVRIVERLASVKRTPAASRLSSASRTTSVAAHVAAVPTPIAPVDAVRSLVSSRSVTTPVTQGTPTVEGFLSKAESAFDAIELGVQDGDSTLVRITADRLRRSCAALGVADMEATSALIGQAASAGDLDTVDALFPRLRREFAQAHVALAASQ